MFANNLRICGDLATFVAAGSHHKPLNTRIVPHPGARRAGPDLIATLVAALALVFGPTMTRAADLPPGGQVGEYDAPAVGRRLRYTVLLPEGYERSGRRYPVLYLLHGFSGNYTSWLTYAGLPPGSATEFGMIIVLPDAGNTCYANWHGAEDNLSRPQRWEDAIADDLTAHLDATFRTVARREGRAIGGLSMGGYGAVVIGLHHPERFCAVVSSAGALRLAERAREELRPSGKPDWNSPRTWEREDARPPVPGSPGFATQDERTPAGLIFTTEAQADAADPFRLVAAAPDKTRLPRFHLDCGTEDGSREQTRAFADLLRREKLSYSLLELPGGHEVPYWANAIRHALPIVRDCFREAVASQGNATGRAGMEP